MEPSGKSQFIKHTGVCVVQFPEKKVTVLFWRIEK